MDSQYHKIPLNITTTIRKDSCLLTLETAALVHLACYITQSQQQKQDG